MVTNAVILKILFTKYFDDYSVHASTVKLWQSGIVWLWGPGPAECHIIGYYSK